LQQSGVRRLQDAIVLGFQMQRVPGKELTIPNWYTNAQKELSLRSAATYESSETIVAESNSSRPEMYTSFNVPHVLDIISSTLSYQTFFIIVQ
jgi:hypothetical protein